MAHWVYVLEQQTRRGRYFYVGSTRCLFLRLKQHEEGTGAVCTRKFTYNIIVALYKIGDGTHLEVERDITLKLMHMFGKQWWIVRGGPWCSTYKNRIKPRLTKHVKTQINVCRCGMPKINSACPKQKLRWLKKALNSDYYKIYHKCY